MPGPNGSGHAGTDIGGRLLGALRQHAVFSLDADGRVDSWSAAAAHLTGLDADDVLHQAWDVFAPAGGRLERERNLQAAVDQGVYQGESWWRRRDGGLVRVEEVIHPLEPDGFVVIARDVSTIAGADDRLTAASAREAAGLDRENSLRDELQAADRRASFLAEASSILVATSLDFDSTVKALARLAVSRLAEWCVIHTLDDDGGLTCRETAHRDPAAEAELRQLLGSGVGADWDRTVRSVMDTGRTHALAYAVTAAWFDEPQDAALRRRMDEFCSGDVIVTPLLGRGHMLGAITFVSPADRPFDDDDSLLAEELGRRAAMALDNARLLREAQEANRAKADFLAVISHELRTPLNAIMGYSDLLDAGIPGDLTDKQRRQIGRIRASARHLLQLIEEILTFARMQSGQDELELEIVDANTIMDEAAAVAEPLARAKGLTFDVQHAAEPVSLETDAGKVRQVLVNLLSNAVKFTERGGVSLRLQVADDHVTFEVADTGIGIGAEQARRIYDPFWQAERPNTRRAGGTGLGLSVSRRFARLLHGDLDVRSEPGQGAHFYFSIPLRLTGRRQSAAPAGS